MENVATGSDSNTGVDLHQLPTLTTLRVSTMNSAYQVVIMEGSSIYVQGGTFFPNLTAASVDGARIGGSLLRVGWIIVGVPMEIRAEGRLILTSPVRAIAIEPPGIPTVP